MKKARKAFGLQFGVRFDSETHSQLLMEGKINLSYSYMTFVMQKHKKVEIYRDYLFDQEQFNYIINKCTSLHDNDLIQDAN